MGQGCARGTKGGDGAGSPACRRARSTLLRNGRLSTGGTAPSTRPSWCSAPEPGADNDFEDAVLFLGAGGFGAATNTAVPGAPVTVTVGELNGDGLPDVAVCSDAANSVTYLLGVGDGTLRAAVSKTVGTTPYGVAIGDVTGEGDPDLVSADFGSSTVTILPGLVTNVSQYPPFQNAVADRILLVESEGYLYSSDNIMFAVQVNAQGAGALFMSPTESTPNISTQYGYVRPFFRVRQSDAAAMRSALRRGPVNVTMTLTPSVVRDGALDNQIVAHEWGHYLTNRLVGNANGLTNLQGGGMGEGWADFVALLMTVRPEDILLPGPPFGGVYASNSYAIDNSVLADNAYYFGVRRYPYSTDFTKSPLTFRHIEEGVDLPAGPPTEFGLTGDGNSEVHGTGEVWCDMLWECYAELLRATGRLTFTQARDRMRNYLVASLKLTPNAPTFVEARDAMLAAALANDPADHAALCAAFARRGLGSGANAPDRFAAGNTGVIESFACGGVQLMSATVQPEVSGCDADGVTDVGERGRVVVRFRNTGTSPLANTSVGVTCTSANVAYPYGALQPVPALAVGHVDSVAVEFEVTANTGIENVSFTPRASDVGGVHDGLAVPAVLNRDYVGTGIANFFDLSGWTNVGWIQGTYGGAPPRADMRSLNAPGPREDRLTTPSFVPTTDAVSITMTHYHPYEYSPSPLVYHDGMVVEMSSDDGATWFDLGASAISDGYQGTISSPLNPLAGRPGYVGPLSEFILVSTFEPVGSFAGKTCRFRVRSAYDETTTGEAGGGYIRYLEIALAAGSQLPFPKFDAEQDACNLVAVDPAPTPRTLSFALRGANPVRGAARFAFDLPRTALVTVDVYDIRGRRVARLHNGVLEAGPHEARWSSPSAAGVYFAQLRAMGETKVIRTVVVE